MNLKSTKKSKCRQKAKLKLNSKKNYFLLYLNLITLSLILGFLIFPNFNLGNFGISVSAESSEAVFLQTEKKKIDFTYTDDNSNENLIIKTNEKTYFGLMRAEIYFSVTNIGDKSEAVNFQVHFPKDKGEVKKIEKYTEDNWQKLELSDNSIPDTRNFLEKSLHLGINRKIIPQNFKVKKSSQTECLIISGQTQYFKMEINCPINSSGEFYIEAIGDKEGYGLLDPWWNSNWSYRKRITIDHTKVDGDLTNFPVLINLSSDAGLAEYAQNDGDDIAFTSSDEVTKLDHEIEYFHGTTGELHAWVEVTTLSASSDTVLYMYYGNGSCGSQENATGVWVSNYLGVYHLTETPDVDSYAYDSTGGNNGTFSAGMTSADQVGTGPIAGSLEFDGSGDYIDITITTGATLTISTWAKYTAGGTDMLWCLNNAGTGGPDLFVGVPGSGVIALNTWNSWSNPFCTVPSNVNEWHLYTTIIQSGTGNTKLYIDNTLCGTANYTNPTRTTFAISSSNNYDWVGGIDEMRLYSGALTESWVKTEYNNQNSPSDFYTLGDEEEPWTLTQNYYQWRENANSVQPGTAKANENTAITGVGVDDILRIRMSVQIGLANLQADSLAFKLQYAQMAGAACGGGDETWSDVDSIAGSKNGALWRGYNNAAPADGATITSHLLSVSDVNESYEEENNSVNNPNGINIGQDGEWDWAVINYAAPVSTDYCFRMVKSGGDALDTYNNYPKLTTSDKGGWVQTTDPNFNAGVKSNTVVSGGDVNLASDASGIDKGDGSDGSLTVTAANTVINHYTHITDATVSSGTATFNVNDATNFSVGDEILIIQMQHSSDSTAGIYEFRDISSKTGNQITVSSNLTNTYYSNDFDNATASATQIVRVPQHTSVTVNSGASIITSAWDGYKGGIVVFRATGTVTVNGTINVTEKGYRGGLHGTPSPCGSGEGMQGEGYPGKGGCGGYNVPGGENPNGGGGGLEVTGGGGGYGTAGTDSDSWNGGSADVGEGGLQHGVANLTQIFLGSGGGGCYQGGSSSGDGGDGGGIIIIFANTVSVSGGMESKGQNGQGYGQGSYLYGTGGGSGGSIYITAGDLTLGDNLVNATGGIGYQTTRDGGDGGTGRIRLDYVNLSGTTNPSPGYTGSDFGYCSSGTIASQVLDCGSSYPNATWDKLSWMETLQSTTDITFDVRASDTSFAKDAVTPSWTDLGSTNSPITSGLFSGRYQQWRATLTNTNTSYTPTLHEALIVYSPEPGTLTVDIVDATGDPVANPSVAMSAQTFSFDYQTSTGTLGISTEKIRVDNGTTNPAWSLTIAATNGAATAWSNSGETEKYDFNDPTANAEDGSDTDNYGGQMTINPLGATITPKSGCSNTDLNPGSSASFSEPDNINNITLLTAGSSAGTNCYWDLTNVSISQTIPASQTVDTYTLDFTLTITAQ